MSSVQCKLRFIGNLGLGAYRTVFKVVFVGDEGSFSVAVKVEEMNSFIDFFAVIQSIVCYGA